MGKYDYTQKKVYMGIDVHKKTYVCVSVCEGEIVKKDTMPAKPSVLINYIKNNFTTAIMTTAYEAGFSGFHLHRCLAEAGIKNCVVHPGSIEVAVRDRVKTDKRDAKKIATQLADGRLRCIYVPSLEQEAKRCASQLRDNMVKLRHQVGRKIKALLFTQEIFLPFNLTMHIAKLLNNLLVQQTRSWHRVLFGLAFPDLVKQGCFARAYRDVSAIPTK